MNGFVQIIAASRVARFGMRAMVGAVEARRRTCGCRTRRIAGRMAERRAVRSRRRRGGRIAIAADAPARAVASRPRPPRPAIDRFARARALHRRAAPPPRARRRAAAPYRGDDARALGRAALAARRRRRRAARAHRRRGLPSVFRRHRPRRHRRADPLSRGRADARCGRGRQDRRRRMAGIAVDGRVLPRARAARVRSGQRVRAVGALCAHELHARHAHRDARQAASGGRGGRRDDRRYVARRGDPPVRAVRRPAAARARPVRRSRDGRAARCARGAPRDAAAVARCRRRARAHPQPDRHHPRHER